MNATLPCASVAPWEAVNVSLCGRKTSAFGGIGSPLSLPQQIVDVLICSDKTVSKTFWSWSWWVCQKSCPDSLDSARKLQYFPTNLQWIRNLHCNSGSLGACSHSHKPGGFIPLNKKNEKKTFILWVSCCLSSIICPCILCVVISHSLDVTPGSGPSLGVICFTKRSSSSSADEPHPV